MNVRLVLSTLCRPILPGLLPKKEQTYNNTNIINILIYLVFKNFESINKGTRNAIDWPPSLASL